MEQKLFKEISNIEEFLDSECFCSLKLLNSKTAKNLLICNSNVSEDEAAEMYYFLLENGNQICEEESALLIEIDNVKFVIINNDFDDFIIIIHKQNLENLENIF